MVYHVKHDLQARKFYHEDFSVRNEVDSLHIELCGCSIKMNVKVGVYDGSRWPMIRDKIN